MRVGVPREIKDNENRVAMTPDGVRTLVEAGHEVTVELEAGSGSGFSDADYLAAGAKIADVAAAWGTDLVLKVKEPEPAEYRYLGGQIVFTYFHLAGVDPGLTGALLAGRTMAVAYETVEDELGRLPLLAPMSAVAGSMAPLVGAWYLARFNGGRGTLPAEILGHGHGEVAIVGDGIVGRHAARVAGAMGARVAVFGQRAERAAEVERIAAGIEYVVSDTGQLEERLVRADMLIGATLVKGARAQHVVSEAMVEQMPEGSVIVDVSIDQGGCVETSRPTSHADPVFTKHGVTHYCVTNMPGAYPRTSTLSLTATTLPYIERLADGGAAAVLDDPLFAKGVNTCSGAVTYRPVAEALGLMERFRELEDL